MIGRRSFALLLTAALALPALAACGAGGASGATAASYPLRIGVIGTGNKLTGVIGYLNDEKRLLPLLAPAGVTEVKSFSFPNGPDLNQALLAGELDIALYGDTPALVARGAGQPTRLIAQNTVGIDAGVLAKKQGGPARLVDLAGKRVATQKGSYIHRYLLGALAEAGIKPQEIVHIYNSDVEAALERGDVDAAAVPAANMEALRLKGYPLINIASRDHPAYLGSSATVVPESFLGARPGFVKVWQGAQREGTRLAKRNWDRYLAFAAKVGGYPAEVTRATTLREQLPEEPFTPQGLRLLENTKRFLVEQKFIRSDFSIEEWIAPGARG
ncbi:ABC transporter substrate-binding protein [Spongiactinospora sp. 9N601]|uniref:ABC transporter substrate-binding protein n=1 Tax=Spongiactinospora sp. 9N601 TaxID=3375149 RepID=UPI0037AB49D2